MYLSFEFNFQGHVASICAVICVVVLLLWRYVRNAATVDTFHDKHVLITGCDSGFGHLLATRLDRLNFNVIAACLTAEGATELFDVSSHRLKTVVLDVTDGESIRRAVQFVSAEVGERGVCVCVCALAGGASLRDWPTGCPCLQ